MAEAKTDVKTSSEFVNPWNPNAIPPITPDLPHLVNPTGEFGPESYIDTGAYSPAKYPRIKTTKKRKAKTVNEDSKKKVRNNLTLKLPEPQGNQSTLDSWLYKPRNPTRVRFCDHVLVKEIIPSYVGLLCAWTTIPIRGYSCPNSEFAIKRKEHKLEMKQKHKWRRQNLTPRRVKRVQHILDTLARENANSSTLS